jgi:hypothetical protein
VGALGLYHEPGQPQFDDAELAFVGLVAPSLAEGARRALLIGEATDPEGPDAPGLVVFSHDGEVESVTPGVERWLAALPDGDWDAGKLPSAVLAVAGRGLRTAEHPDEPGQVAVSRVLSRSGTWVVLHGASLVAGGAHRVAVIVEPAHPATFDSGQLPASTKSGTDQAGWPHLDVPVVAWTVLRLPDGRPASLQERIGGRSAGSVRPFVPGAPVDEGIGELGCWVVGRPQFEEVRQSGEAPRQVFIVEGEQLSPMWPRLVGRERGLDVSQQGHDLGWMLAPGEADAQAVAPMGGAEPQVVGGGGADLGGVQLWRDAVTEGAKGP